LMRRSWSSVRRFVVNLIAVARELHFVEQYRLRPRFFWMK
jgi:hypothetical protein